MAFAGGGSSVLAVAGADDRGGCVMLLDTLVPPAAAAIARINCSHVRTRDVMWPVTACFDADLDSSQASKARTGRPRGWQA